MQVAIVRRLARVVADVADRSRQPMVDNGSTHVTTDTRSSGMTGFTMCS
jgi:hypothetical protein